jgi:signal transduction histidine kinase
VRRRLIVTSLAVTSLVVLAFVVPLGGLVRDLAHDRASSAAERDAEGIARFLAVVAPSRGMEETVDALGGEALSEFPVSVILPDGMVIGAPLFQGEDLAAAAQGSTVRVALDGGEAVYVPVLQSDGSKVVVRVFVSDAELREGVVVSWVTLAVLGLVLIGIAAFVSDRLARSIVAPVEDLSATAAALGHGDLDVRVRPAGPKEIHDVGIEFNQLAERVNQLLQQERETAADLSHRLRTPLTAVRLDAEALQDGPERTRLLDDIDDLVRHVDFVIREARREVRRQPGVHGDVAGVVGERLDYWAALAEEQHRTVAASIVPGPVVVPIAVDELRAMVDALVGNVFAHTPEATALQVALTITDGAAQLTIEDAGPGFPDASVLRRGASGGSGTGLGLDIARRTAESAGGFLVVARSGELGGAAAAVTLPLAD